LSFAHVYNRQGLLVASLAQEGLIRMREKKP
jgi:acyl-CoA thioesterase